MKPIIYCCVMFLSLAACKDASQKPDNGMQEVRLDDKLNNKDFIRNPVTILQPIDTNNVAKMTFSAYEMDFGTVKAGTVVKRAFKFTNTGKVPLVITSASSTCGCTVPSFNKAPIQVGASDEIMVQFDTKGKQQQQAKVVEITANTVPAITKIVLKGNVIAAAH